MLRASLSFKRRKLGASAGNDKLVNLLRTLQSLQRMDSQIEQINTIGQIVGGELLGGERQKDLAAVT